MQCVHCWMSTLGVASQKLSISPVLARLALMTAAGSQRMLTTECGQRSKRDFSSFDARYAR
jgi:hypothetical protein